MMLLRILIVTLVTFAFACASTPKVTYTQAQLDAATASGELHSFFEQVREELDGLKAKSKSRPALESILGQAGQKIAAQDVATVEQRLRADTQPSARVPLESLAFARAKASEIERYDSEVARRLVEMVEAEETKTRAHIAELETQVSASENVLDTSALREQIARHQGGLAVVQWQSAQNDEKNRLERILENSQTSTEEAKEAARQLRAIASSDPGIAELLARTDSKLFEQEFWQALADGEPEEAYERFKAILEAGNFEEVRPRLEGSAGTMAQFFVTLAATATRDNELGKAYRWFRQARHIRRVLERNLKAEVDEEQIFVDAMHQRFEAASAKGLHGLAWAYLNVVKELRPQYPALRRDNRQTKEKVLRVAIKRLSAGAFEDSKAATEFGATVGSKVVQYLFETIPNDVRIIERARLENVDFEDANYLLQGTILEARVDTTEKDGRQTMRVVTETEEVTNPRYEEWGALPKKKRETSPEPSGTVFVERKEDVTLTVTHHRKVGLFSASFRLIDARTAKVLYADSVRSQKEYADSSSEGIELGSFKKEFKLANLPSDLQILAALADDISSQIGGALSEILALPEQRYEFTAGRFAGEDSHLDASEQYAYAMALRTRKDEEVTLLRDRMMASALSVDPAALE